MWGKGRHVLAKEIDAASRGRKVAGDGVEQRCLTRTVGAENSAPFSRLQRQFNIVEGRECTKSAAHALKLEGVSRCGLGYALCAFRHRGAFTSLALWIVTADTPDGHELGAVHVQRLVHAGDHLHNLVGKTAVRRLRDLGDE